MGILATNSADLGEIRLRPFPTKSKDITRMARKGHVIVGIDAKGNLYTNSRYSKPGYYIPGDWFNMEDLLRCLVKLGVAEQGHVDAYMAAIQARNRKADAGHALGYTQDELGKLGVKLTKTQVRKLEAIADGEVTT